MEMRVKNTSCRCTTNGHSISRRIDTSRRLWYGTPSPSWWSGRTEKWWGCQFQVAREVATVNAAAAHANQQRGFVHGKKLARRLALDLVHATPGSAQLLQFLRNAVGKIWSGWLAWLLSSRSGIPDTQPIANRVLWDAGAGDNHARIVEGRRESVLRRRLLRCRLEQIVPVHVRFGSFHLFGKVGVERVPTSSMASASAVDHCGQQAGRQH